MVLEIPSRPENVPLARLAVASFAAQMDFTVGELEEIKVAVSEAVTNSVLHAYEEPGRVRITATRDGGRLVVEVADWGRGIQDVDRARQAPFTTRPERMGLGFAFMESFMDEVLVESRPGQGTAVRMTKTPTRAGCGGCDHRQG